MTKYAEIQVGEIFKAVNGRAKFIMDYIDVRPGPYPVYSASLTKPFGHVDEFEHNGHFLTWVMNGYGGRVQEVSGKFSANRDRGVFVPKEDVEIPDLTYLRFAMEPQLVAAAVGRRVDGRLNEYTKIYPETAKEVTIQLPLTSSGKFDYVRMSELGAKFRRIESAQAAVRKAQAPLLRAAFAIGVSEPTKTISLSEKEYFTLSIGKRVLRTDHAHSGVPVYSANALVPFGMIHTSNLSDFGKPSLLWGIDGTFDWNLIPAEEEFATTDHCGRLQILDAKIDPNYVFWFLCTTRSRYGFDRVYRASLQNMKAEVTVTIPLDDITGEFSLKRQHELAEALRRREQARTASLAALEDVLKARIAAEM